jgi:hypothetical protein
MEETVSQVFRHDLGDRVKDVVTGITGIVVSRSESLFGCARYWLQPEGHKDGKPHDGCWFDEESLQVVEAGAVKRPTYARVAVAEQPARRAFAGGPSDQPAAESRVSGR